ncbi:MAG TPA: FlgD immunoglobulin-like domain containing protein, partial [bacterium]|nr:FlgD immunoglobulin-like domain containing protein [bacterium]
DFDWSRSSVAASVAEMSFDWNEPGGVQETDFEISFDVDGAWNTDLFPPDPIFPPDPVQPESILLSFPVALRFGNGAVHGISDTRLSLDVSPDQAGSLVFQNIAVTPNGSSSRIAAGWTDGFTLSFRVAYSGMGSPDDNFPLFTASWRSDWNTQIPTAALGTMPEGSERLTAAPSITSGGTRIRTARPLDRAAAIDIHDVTGRRVRSLSIPAGSDAVRWDGRDGDGLPSAAGVYFVRLNGHSGPATRVVRVP